MPVIPIIDVDALRAGAGAAGSGVGAGAGAGAGAGVDAVIAAIDAACMATGFFVVVGHGVDDELRGAFEAAHSFFAQPLAAKLEVAMVGNEGFVPIGAAPVNPAMAPEPKERLDLNTSPSAASGADARNASGADGSPSSRWPALAGFRELASAYQHAALDLAADLLRAMAIALDIEATFFAERMRRPQCVLRMMHYAPMDRVDIGTVDGAVAAGAASAEPTLAAGPHTDYGAITLLATDGVPGLEVHTGGEWVPVVAPAGSFVVNLGDMLARWTNGRYASTMHRVVGQRDQHRYSIPFFVNPDPQTRVACLPSCVTTERPCGYEPITAAEFLRGRIDGTILTGS
jgi:isopenicillin N synthase-like dioxygenase